MTRDTFKAKGTPPCCCQAETSNARGEGQPGINRLRISQWLDIVTSPQVLEALRNYKYEDAVDTAIHMTEQKMAENFAAALSQQPVDKWRLVIYQSERDTKPGVWATDGNSFVWVADLATQHQEPTT